MKVAGAKLDQIGIVERRGRNGKCARRHRIAHTKGQKPLNDAPMAPACGDVVDTGPSEKHQRYAEPGKRAERRADNSP